MLSARSPIGTRIIPIILGQPLNKANRIPSAAKREYFAENKELIEITPRARTYSVHLIIYKTVKIFDT
jgi:hypothetical protein